MGVAGAAVAGVAIPTEVAWVILAYATAAADTASSTAGLWYGCCSWFLCRAGSNRNTRHRPRRGVPTAHCCSAQASRLVFFQTPVVTASSIFLPRRLLIMAVICDLPGKFRPCSYFCNCIGTFVPLFFRRATFIAPAESSYGRISSARKWQSAGFSMASCWNT